MGRYRMTSLRKDKDKDKKGIRRIYRLQKDAKEAKNKTRMQRMQTEWLQPLHYRAGSMAMPAACG